MKLGNKPKRLFVNEKTGYRNVTGKHVLILDENYEPFYDTSIVNNLVWEFNLPKGIYYLETGKIQPRVSPVEYKLDPLPKFNRCLKGDPETFPIIYGDNKYTASVFWDAERSPFGKRCIFLDNSVKQWSKPQKIFVLYHECAHKYWNDSPAEEAACDSYARNKMLAEGYNPSQVGMSIIKTLSPRNEYRVLQMMDNLQGL